MPTTRTRRGRRKSALPAHIKALFDVGCAWNSYGDAEVQRLWDEHGANYLRTCPDPARSFAVILLGEPNKEHVE